jgi:hypothetical protein
MRLNQARPRGATERIPPITRRSNANTRGAVAHRAFCVAAAIALLTVRGSAAWAVVEDVGAPGPAILDDASGSSGITNKADALRFDDARFAFRDPSAGSTFLSVGGRFVPIVGAGLEPSQEGQDDPGRPSTAFDYGMKENFYSGALDAIPESVNDSRAVDTIIQSDFMLNGAGDSLITDPVGATGYWPTIYGSSPFAWSAGTVSPRRLRASCSNDGSSSAVMSCVLLEDRIALGLPTDEGKGAQAAYQSGQANFGEGAASPGLGAPTWQRNIASATLSTAPIYFSVASEATLPVFTAVSPPVLDIVFPNVNPNPGPIGYPAGSGGFGGGTKNTPSVPELPAPALFVIGLGGIALARRVRLRPSARFA